MFFVVNRYWNAAPPPAPKPAPAACPAFSRDEQSCTFGAAITWVDTGTRQNLQPCIIPMPRDGSYVLWQGDKASPPTVWTPASPLLVINVYGFQSKQGPRTVRYRLVEFADHCGTSF